MSNTALIITVAVVVLLPVAWFVGGILFKMLWGYAPIVLGLAGAAYSFTYGFMTGIMGIAGGLLIGLLITWFWQRTRIFLNVDRWIETHVFFDR